MKKIFTLLSLCLLTLTSYAQEWLSAPISGKQYYIAVGHQKVGYIIQPMKMVLISRLRLRAKLINQNKRGLVRRIPTKHGLLHSLLVAKHGRCTPQRGNVWQQELTLVAILKHTRCLITMMILQMLMQLLR